MRERDRDGFDVIELAVASAAVMLLVLALVPAVSNAVRAANMTPVGTCGRDIYVAITGANTEREPLGLPPVWPSDGSSPSQAYDGDISTVRFANSTDYFKYLCDEPLAGTQAWSPYVSGFDCSKLAGAGVPACATGKLQPENNMWTIAMNVPKELPDTVPVLITRNIDASSLAAKATDRDWDKSLRFDSRWETPFGNQAFALVRHGGAVFKAREKYRSYRVVYQQQTFDATVDEQGRPAARPLTYLTPSGAVVPGEGAYAEGAARLGRDTAGFWVQVRRDLAALGGTVFPVGIGVALAYLLALIVYASRRGRDPERSRVTGYGWGIGLFHYAALVLWVSLFITSVADGLGLRWTLLALALLAQAAGIVFASACRRNDPASRQRALKWMVSVPLVLVGLAALGVAIGVAYGVISAVFR